MARCQYSHSMKSLLCLLTEAFLPLELRPLGHKNISLSNWAQNFFYLVTRNKSEWCLSHFHPLIPGPPNPGYGRNSILDILDPHILDSDSQHIQPSENLVTTLQGIVT